jgi:ElaB/YqjD/DUF883 family membrane-anchored ribosome-binding protein
MAEEGNIGGAGPALAAHSKDGSAAGPNAASSTRGQPSPSSRGASSNQALNEMVGQVCDFVQEKHFLTAALTGATGLMIGLMARRR